MPLSRDAGSDLFGLGVNKAMSSFTIAWWNTGLVPPRGAPNTGETVLRDVAEGVARLLDTTGADLVCLGEVNPEVIDAIRIRVSVLGVRSLAHQARNLGILFNGMRCSTAHIREVVAQFGTSRCHAGWYSKISIDASAVGLWIVHWPSDRAPDGAERRCEAARALRDSVIEQGDLCGKVVIGDFNEEPFNDNVTWHLRSSRERAQIVAARAHFYNPFWKHQGEMGLLDGLESERRGPGTIRLSSLQRELTQWRLVDFAVVDRLLLTGERGWRLAESRTRIVNLQGPSDHLPIVVSIDHVVEEGK